ncbi:MAG: Rrf2 family transcriptional regulator [Actinomycetota bacterium]
MRLTREADYAVRLVVDLAENGSSSTVTVAGRQSIPAAVARRVVRRLSVAGVVRTTVGAAGGVRLARPADEVNLREVVEAIEGPIALNACQAVPSECDRKSTCTAHLVWDEIQATIVEKLEHTTAADVAERKRASAVPCQPDRKQRS